MREEERDANWLIKNGTAVSALPCRASLRHGAHAHIDASSTLTTNGGGGRLFGEDQ